MRYTVKLLFLISILISCEEKQLDASTIISKAISSYGGEAALRDIKTKKELGTSIIYLQDTVFRKSNYIEYFKTPNKTYYESPVTKKLTSSKLIFASNGKISWTQNDGAYAPYIQPKNEIVDLKGEDYPYLFTLEERGVTVTYVDKIVQDDNELHHLQYKSEGGLVEDVYFDDKTGLISKTVKVIQTSIGPAEVNKTFSDYKIINGIAIPFQVESYFPPKELNLYIINDLEINEGINDSIFEFPKPPLLSSTEIAGIVGTYKGENIKLIIDVNGENLVVQRDENPLSKLLVVKNNFFMYRIGEEEQSHIENIFVEKVQNNKVQKLKLIDKKDIYILSLEE